MPWEKNGTPNTLNIAGDVLSVDDLTAAQNNEYLFHELNTGNVNLFVTYNNDTGTNYADRVSFDGGTDAISVSRINTNPFAGGNIDGFTVNYLVDVNGKAKLAIVSSVDQGATGAGSAPVRTEQVHKYSEGTTFPQITSIQYTNPNAGDYAVDSNLSALSDVVPIPETIGGWVELGRGTLGSVATNIDVSGLATKRYYMILHNGLENSGSINSTMRTGISTIDTGSNYAARWSQDGSSDSTSASRTNMLPNGAHSSAGSVFMVPFLTNLSDQEKLLTSHWVGQSTAGAGTSPVRAEAVSKWANTTAPFDILSVIEANGNDFAFGSQVVVLGWDPDDIHSGNFWEELASADLSGGADPTLSSGTFTAKKYLWVQIYCSLASSGTVIVRFNNNTTTTNYSIRTSTDGAADGTNTNRGKWDVWQATNTTVPMFVNMFIVNNGSNEALGTWHTVLQGTSGAGNVPQRQEGVGKFVPTTQITEIDVTEFNSSINLNTHSTIKVWGSD